jgi:hypothetical protein
VFVADPSDNIGSFARFRVNLPVASNQPVCDRATRSDQIDTPPPSPGPLLRSNTLCLPGDPDPVVPEFNLAVVLPLTGILLAAVVWFTRRRHNAITA